VRSTTFNQNGEQVQTFTAKIIVFKRPVDANSPTPKSNGS